MTEQQQTDLISFIATGCPMETALEGTGVSREEFDELLRSGAELVQRMHRGGALSEFQQLQNVKQAGRETKYWRASVWWLERCRGDRYTAKPPGTITLEQLAAFRNDLARIIDSEVHDPGTLERLLAKLSSQASHLVPTKDIATERKPTHDDR